MSWSQIILYLVSLINAQSSYDEHTKSSKQNNITQVSWPLTHCLEKHSIFLFYNIPVSKIIHSAFLIGYKNGRNNNDFNMLSSVWRPKNPVSLIFPCLFFSLQYKNLEKPYPTNCTKRSLKAYTSYTVEGCFFECKAEIITKKCGCRLSGYTGMM